MTRMLARYVTKMARFSYLPEHVDQLPSMKGACRIVLLWLAEWWRVLKPGYFARLVQGRIDDLESSLADKQDDVTGADKWVTCFLTKSHW